jgi:ATP-dependent DNA helicase RecQ
LTAAATAEIQRDIFSQLQLDEPIVTKGSFDRPNLYYKVICKKGLAADLSFLKNVQKSTIIYCNTVAEVEEIRSFLCVRIIDLIILLM